MSLLEVVTTPPCTFAEQPLLPWKVGLDPRFVEDVWSTSPALGAAEEVMSTALMVPAGPSTTILPPEDGLEVMAPPSLDDAGLGSSHGLERVDATEFFSVC